MEEILEEFVWVVPIDRSIDSHQFVKGLFVRNVLMIPVDFLPKKIVMNSMKFEMIVEHRINRFGRNFAANIVVALVGSWRIENRDPK